MNPWKSPDLSFRRRHLPHLEVPDATYFVSFSSHQRIELPPEARDFVMAAIRTLDGKSIELDAVVVMPDHVHAIFRVIGSKGLVHVLKNIKGSTAHKINEQLGRRGPIWTQESFDHVVRNDAELEEKIDYIRHNAARKGLVTSLQQYQWLYVKK